jgi:hypothetical protein
MMGRMGRYFVTFEPQFGDVGGISASIVEGMVRDNRGFIVAMSSGGAARAARDYYYLVRQGLRTDNLAAGRVQGEGTAYIYRETDNKETPGGQTLWTAHAEEHLHGVPGHPDYSVRD